MEANAALRLEAIASGLEATASRLEAIATRLEAIESKLEAIAILLLEAIVLPKMFPRRTVLLLRH